MTQPSLPTANSKLYDLAAILAIIALSLLFFWRIITLKIEDRAQFPPGDFTDQFWAFRMEEARAFAQGHLPLWSEYYNSGHPFLADVQSAIFYPPSLIWTLVVVAVRGANFSLFDLEIEAIFHFMLAGVFTYLFARELLRSRAAALVAALTFTFSGYLTSYPPQQLAILETAVWLPLVLLFLHRALFRGGVYYFLAGLALGIASLAGHPQTLLFVIYASAIYFFWECRHHSHTLPHYIVRFMILIIIAAGISAAQWIPTIEYQLVSTRSSLSWADAAGGFPTLDPIQMILPGFINAFQSPLYLGVLPLWLAILSLFVNRSREKTYWALLALGSLLISFGFYAFAYAIFYLGVPGFAMFRGQERLALIVTFSLALLTGYGARDLISTQLEIRRGRRAWALLPAGIVISALFVLTMYISGTVRQSGRVAFLGDRAGLMLILFLLASILTAWSLRAQRPNPAALILLSIALIAFDLFSINTQPYNAKVEPRYPVTPLVQVIQADPDLFRVVDEGKEPGHFGIAYRLEEIGGISPLRMATYEALLDNLPEEKLWPILNVKYVLTGRPGFANAALIANDGDTRLLRLENQLPRAWFVTSVKDQISDSAMLDLMKSNAFDPRQTALVADRFSYPVDPDSSHTAATFVRTSPEHSQIDVTAPKDGLLVLSGNYYYPGWTAHVDGVLTPIVRTDLALSAIPVRANSQKVDLIFDPWSVKIGMVISGLVAAGTLAIIFLTLFKSIFVR